MQAPFVDPLLLLQERPRKVLPLVGRDIELHLLRRLLETVYLGLATGARAATISGEMGVGKTRLLAQLCWEAEERGFRVVQAKAYEASRMFPYFPFVEALRPILHSLHIDTLRRYVGLPTLTTQLRLEMTSSENTSLTGIPLVTALTRLFPELPALLRVQTESEILSPDQEKFRLLDAIATFLERMAVEQPLLVCLDNAQWADSASQELTIYLTVRLHTSRVALIGLTRPSGAPRTGEEPSETDMVATQATAATVMRILTDLIQQGMLLFLPLASLNTEAATEHIHALLPGTVPPSIVQALLTRADGNPFFLEELVRTLTINQQLILHDGAWSMTQPISTKLPGTIVLAVRQRLQGLSQPCLDLLYSAALFGRTFPIDALLQVVEHYTKDTGNDPQTMLHEAEQASLIRRGGSGVAMGGEDPWVAPLPDEPENAQDAFADSLFRVALPSYTFSQGIVQEVLHADVPAQRVRTLHQAIAQALEQCYGYEAREHAAELASHYALSGNKEATLRWSLLAGEEAMRQQAHREAISHLRLALKLVEAAVSTPDSPSASQLYLTIGDLWFKLGEMEQAAHALQRALEQAQQQEPSPLLLAHINRSLSDVYRQQAKYELALSHLQATRAALDKEAMLEQQYTPAQAPWFIKSSFSASAGTMTIERINNNERILFLQAQAMLDVLLNREQEAEETLWKSHELAITLGDRSSQAFALYLIGWIRGWDEHIHESLRLQKQAHELYIALGDPFRATLADQGIGAIYQALGEIEQAQAYTQHGFERAHRYGVRRVLGLLHWNQGIIALTQGDWTESETHLQQAMQEAERHSDARLKPIVLVTQAELQFRRGQWHEAEQLFQDAVQAATNTEWLPGTIALYGHFLAVTGRRAAAQVQLDRASEFPKYLSIAGSLYIPFLAEGYLHLDTIEHATSYFERITRLRGFLHFGISVDRILGELAVLNKNWEAADHCFEAGLRLCRRAGNEPEEAAILYEQARLAVVRNDSIQHITDLCQQAHTLFLHYNMQRAADLVNTLLEGVKSLPAPKQLTSQPIHKLQTAQKEVETAGYVLHLKLSAREQEVLQLVAEGHTDREVADILVLSPRTVNRHLSNIFVKLDVPGRAAAVAYAIRQGLV